MELTLQQKKFIELALSKKNILVEACIGSGKTTSIQHLCNRIPADKNVLYLTYSKLLKLDAKDKIKNSNVFVTNYHGFAFNFLKKIGVIVGQSDLIQTFNKLKPSFPKYDVLIIDEYQDIDTELSHMLKIIKETNPNMQIIAVGDMDQKIFNKTTLNVSKFIHEFLGDYVELEFTACFRLNKELALKLGQIWEKKIEGINDKCNVQIMEVDEVIEFLSHCEPKDILCLGSRTGKMSQVLNRLEADYPGTFNKKTIYASINDEDKKVSPKKNSAIFTTYDSCKGLESKNCIVFDFNKNYWDIRSKKPDQDYTILKNIFCVAASRGKENIIFVDSGNDLLDVKTISTPVLFHEKLTQVNISEMFDFKFKESVEKCFSFLNIKEIKNNDRTIINVKDHDGLIDLSPCIGIYQEAFYFNGYDIDKSITLLGEINRNYKYIYKDYLSEPVDKKVLFLVSLETKQNRYRNQVVVPYIDQAEEEALFDRLSTIFTKDEIVQKKCTIDFKKNTGYSIKAVGYCDVIKDDIVYELKYVNALTHEHYLQCACYIVGLGMEKGILWNTKDNSMYEISVNDKNAFLKMVAKTVLKIKEEQEYE